MIPKKYLTEMRKICNQHNILMALDEVQCGIGRTGKLFAYEWSNIKPDLLTSAKGLGGGFPIGAILLSKKVSQIIKPGSHGSTFGGNQLACAVSLAVLNEISKKLFLKNVLKVGEFIRNEIKTLIKKYPKKIEAVYGKGLMLGIKCRTSNLDICNSLRAKGLLVVPASNNVIRLLPPLNISLKDSKVAIKMINEALGE